MKRFRAAAKPDRRERKAHAKPTRAGYLSSQRRAERECTIHSDARLRLRTAHPEQKRLQLGRKINGQGADSSTAATR